MKTNVLLYVKLLLAFTSVHAQEPLPLGQPAPTDVATVVARGQAVSELPPSIFYVFQDRNNDFWFGSDKQGVYRFDGTVMTQFTTTDGLSNNQIRGIQQDPAGNLYFTTIAQIAAEGSKLPSYRADICKFDGESFSTLTPTEKQSPDGNWMLRNDDLWFAAAQDEGAVFRFDGESLHRLAFPKTQAGEEHIAKYPRSKYPQMNYSPYDTYCIFRDSQGCMWFGTNLGVCRYDGSSFAWLSEEDMGFDDQGRAFNVRSMMEDNDGHFWLSHTFQRWTVSPQDSGKPQMAFSKAEGMGQSKVLMEDGLAYFMSCVMDRHGHLWMATYSSGVWRYDGKSLVHYPVQNGNTPITLFSIYQDHQGGLWLGTHSAGALKFNGTTFETFSF